jgi:predicted ABC-class ATPase
MQNKEKLLQTLKRIDGRGYKAYTDIEGIYDFKKFKLYIDHVQRDPFASPSLVRVEVPAKDAAFPSELFGNFQRKIALEDYISRAFHSTINHYSGGKSGSGHSGVIKIDSGNQEVLERSCVNINSSKLEVRFSMGLPARGRRVLGKAASKMFAHILPKIVNDSCFYSNLNSQKVEEHVKTVEDAGFIRDKLDEMGLVTFVADGSILPRESGVSDKPLKHAVEFRSPESLTVTIETPNHGPITGMGIPKGVTLIIGGGYHGKSTLLHAVERGVYNHLPQDGREFVVTCSSAVKIRAEDGRRVEKVDISSFIHNPPASLNTREFSTENASGSTSQASNIIEAVEMGSKLLLFDEDTSATNFMIRDERMQRLVAKEKEPITPFIDRVRELYEKHGTSTVIVMGGSGDYFEVADNIIMMDSYRPYNVTGKAREVARDLPVNRIREVGCDFSFSHRSPQPESIKPFKGRKLKLDCRGLSTVLVGRENVDISQVEQIVHPSQTRAIAYAIYHASRKHMDGKTSLLDVLKAVKHDIEEGGLDVLALKGRKKPNNLAKPRIFEIAAAVNRLRTLKMKMVEVQKKDQI